MLLFGHAGITFGAATLLAGVAEKKRNSGEASLLWFTSLSRFLDVRLLLIGSLLPDIIDKPIGQLFFRETFNNGRIFSHTLLFLVLLFCTGMYIYRHQHRIWMLTLAFGSLTHLILDGMWREPSTLFWPLLGFTFEITELEYWASNILQALISMPEVYIPEILGLIIIIWFGLSVVFRKRIVSFFKNGSV